MHLFLFVNQRKVIKQSHIAMLSTFWPQETGVGGSPFNRIEVSSVLFLYLLLTHCLPQHVGIASFQGSLSKMRGHSDLGIGKLLDEALVLSAYFHEPKAILTGTPVELALFVLGLVPRSGLTASNCPIVDLVQLVEQPFDLDLTELIQDIFFVCVSVLHLEYINKNSGQRICWRSFINLNSCFLKWGQNNSLKLVEGHLSVAVSINESHITFDILGSDIVVRIDIFVSLLHHKRNFLRSKISRIILIEHFEQSPHNIQSGPGDLGEHLLGLSLSELKGIYLVTVMTVLVLVS